MFAAIWAQDVHGVIGKEGRLPWHLPNDLKFFKEKTLNQTIIMGRKTFEGMGSRALPNRETIVLTSDQTYQAEGVIVLHSVAEILAYTKDLPHDVLVTGGTGVFESMLDTCDTLYRTVIEDAFEGDTYFPKIDWTAWTLVSTVSGTVDEKNRYPHRFETYRRKK